MNAASERFELGQQYARAVTREDRDRISARVIELEIHHQAVVDLGWALLPYAEVRQDKEVVANAYKVLDAAGR